MDAYSILLIFSLIVALVMLFSAGAASILYYQFQKANQYITALEEASDVTGFGLVFFDAQNRFVDANKPARTFLPGLFGPNKLRATQLLTLSSFFNFCYDHAADIDATLLIRLGRFYDKREHYNFREVIRAAEDRLCIVEAQPLNDGGTGFIIIDIGDVKQREEYVLRLNQQNRELFEAIEATSSGIIITKADDQGQQVVTFVNHGFCKMFEYERDNILGQDVMELCRSRGDRYLLSKLRRFLKQETGGTVELGYKTADQAQQWYDLKLTPVSDHDGRLELYIGIVSDISDVKDREAEISRVQRLDALGQLAAGMAHDFNNVLSIIDGYARLTAGVSENNAKALEYLEKIKTATDRGANLIKRMLAFSRHKIVDEDVIDLAETIREQEQLLQPLLNASIKFHILCDRMPMYVKCGQDTITQIVMNLVVNARDAMPQGGALFVEVRACDEQNLPDELKQEDEKTYCVLSVADTGTGIEPEVLGRIFDPFFTTKDKDKGTGLGLSMIYGLVKQNGGLIKVDTKPGEGTAMRLYFPLASHGPKAISGSFDNLDDVSFEGYTVLLAEDEPDLRELVGNMLEKHGMIVLRAADGHEALFLEDDFCGKIDLLLTDVVMPELNGVDLADLLGELQPEMKVIFMSGYPAKGQNAHMDIPKNSTFIAKPIVHEDLLRLIYHALSDGDETDSQARDVRTSRWQSEGPDKTTSSRKEYAS